MPPDQPRDVALERAAIARLVDRLVGPREAAYWSDLERECEFLFRHDAETRYRYRADVIRRTRPELAIARARDVLDRELARLLAPVFRLLAWRP